MIKVENIETWGFEHAIRGMRNPMNSWDKSDSEYNDFNCGSCGANCKETTFTGEKCIVLGENDKRLMQNLYNAGTEHRKFMRQIFVSMDITAPLYWWKEFDTYKVGTVANSCSTMHKIHAKEFTLDDFSHEHLDTRTMEVLKNIVKVLNDYRTLYMSYNAEDFEVYECPSKKDIWWQMIQLLPSSYNQKRTVTMNYENAVSMIRQRQHHKLDEWRFFTDILKNLPYMKEVTGL